MKRINFRVWSCYDRKYLPLAFEDSELYISPFGVIRYTNLKKDSPCLPQDELVVEIYTGLKDKGGNKIYEGDILRFDSDLYKGLVGEVVFREDYGYFACRIKEGGKWSFNSIESFELIGNIHTDYNLLEIER